MELGSHLGPHRAERMLHVSGLDLNLIHIHLQLLYNEPYLETTNTELNFNIREEIQGTGTFRRFLLRFA
jgi:hypothetical protein